MELYFIKDSISGLYYIEEDKPFFYSFSTEEGARKFKNTHPDTCIEIVDIEDAKDKEFLMTSLYQRGYKGGYKDGVFSPINRTNPELTKFIPSDATLLNVKRYLYSKDLSLLEGRFYLFATINQKNYLSYAATKDGNIFAFTDLNNIDTALAKALYNLGYDLVRMSLDNRHSYLINPNRTYQTLIQGK